MMASIPRELEAFEHTLVRSIRRRQNRLLRSRYLIASFAAALLLAGTAVAATRAFDEPTLAQQNHTENLDAARTLLTSFQEAHGVPADTDIAATRLLAVMPSQTGTYSGLNAYVAPTGNGGACIAMLNAASCGAAPSDAHPVQALGLGQGSTTPFLLVGIEGKQVTKHVVRCGGTSEDVTGNLGGATFVFIAPSPGIDPSACTQVFTLQTGAVVTTPI